MANARTVLARGDPRPGTDRPPGRRGRGREIPPGGRLRTPRGGRGGDRSPGEGIRRHGGDSFRPSGRGASRRAGGAGTGRCRPRMAGRGRAAAPRAAAAVHPAAVDRGPASPPEAWRVFEGVAQLLSAVAAEQPIVVTIDDLHWCDEDSANLLRFLIRRLEQLPVLWLATVTLGEMERDAPAARLTRVLRAKSHATSISLALPGRRGSLAADPRAGSPQRADGGPTLRSPGVQHHRRQPVLHPGAAQDHVRAGTAGDRRADPRVDGPGRRAGKRDHVPPVPDGAGGDRRAGGSAAR